MVANAGDCISVDQLQSTMPGIIATMSSFLSKRRYHYVTVFVDHKTNIDFVYLQETSGGEETLKAKHAFENYARARGGIIWHYHCDNG